MLKDPASVKKYGSGFRPNRDKIYSLLKERIDGSTSNITFSKCDYYIRDLLEDCTFLTENESLSQEYPEIDFTEDMLLHRVTEPQKTAYFRKKEQWKLKTGELDDMLLYLERRKKLNQNIEDKYFRAFAKSEIEKSKLWYRSEKLRIIMTLIPNHPNVPYRELVRRAEDSMLTADKMRKDLKKKNP